MIVRAVVWHGEGREYYLVDDMHPTHMTERFFMLRSAFPDTNPELVYVEIRRVDAANPEDYHP